MLMILLSACAGWVWVYQLKVHRWHKILNRKPFACEACMSGWIAVILCWHGWWTPAYMCGAIVTNVLLTSIIKYFQSK